MFKTNPLLWAAVSGFFVVALGAFGAHGLSGHITADLLAAYQTGVHYQGLHTLALLAVALLLERDPDDRLDNAAIAFLAGIVLFSGSLYLMAITDYRALGVVTPFGGLAFLAGWGLLARYAWTRG